MMAKPDPSAESSDGSPAQPETPEQTGHAAGTGSSPAEPGPYYGFWSGFGSVLEEFGILGAIGAAIYSLVRKYNCHEPGCWRIGNHPAAGGQFHLCYRHHPDFQGKKPTHEVIERLHREHLERQEAIHRKLSEVHQHLIAKQATANEKHAPGAHAATAGGGDSQAE